MKIIKLALLLILGGFSLFKGLGCALQADEPPMERKIPVKTEIVTSGLFSKPIHTSGKIFSTAEIKLSFKIPGIVEKLFTDEGTSVQKGDLLAQLNLAEVEARLAQAQSGFEKARRDFQRVQKLFTDSVATLEQLQDAETGVKVARSNLDIAQFNRRHALITAPTVGKILRRFVEANELIPAGAPVFLFGSSEKEWLVRVAVTDRDILKLQLGDSAKVAVDAYPEVIFSAYITELGEAANPLNGTYEVELTIDSAGLRLVSGFVARVDIFPSKKYSYRFIPVEAVVEADGDDAFVYQLDPSKELAKRVPIKIGFILNDRVAVVAGLEKVVEVVTEGAPYLSDGSRILVVK
ncbi:MAG: efflux RND transporter periplasmic adaptor subunit [bacterium]